MKRIPQEFRIIVQEKGDEKLTSTDVKLRALNNAGLVAHPKYLKRVVKFTQPHPFPIGKRVWTCVVVRP